MHLPSYDPVPDKQFEDGWMDGRMLPSDNGNEGP